MLIFYNTGMTVMPRDCPDCASEVCFEANGSGTRPEKCPLVEVDENVLRDMGVVIQRERAEAEAWAYGERTNFDG